MRLRVHLICGALLFSAFLLAQTKQKPPSDWLTWGGDAERTGWAKSETAFSKDNVSQLELKWKAQLDNVSGMEVLAPVTAPLVVENTKTRLGLKTLVYAVGSSDSVYALDAANGKVFWKRKFQNDIKPVRPPNALCPNTQNATPVIDKQAGIIYVLTSDGKLRGMNIADGEDRFPPTDWVTPHSRNWSLNLVDGVMYVTVARGCGGSISNITAMDLKDPAHPVAKYTTSTGRPNGSWGRAGAVLGPKGLYMQTADGPFDPTRQLYSNSVMVFKPKTLELADYYTPANEKFLTEKDLDLGSSGPVAFPFQKWSLVAAGAKEGTIYLLDAESIGGPEHRTPLFAKRYGNDEFDPGHFAGRGIWGAMSTYVDAQGQRWLLAPMWGPISRDAGRFKIVNGMAESGSIMAFKLIVENDKPALSQEWMSRSMAVPEPPVVTNGVVFALSNGENTKQTRITTAERTSQVSDAILYALDATNGKELWASNQLIDDWTHYAGLAVGGGRIYLSTYHNRVYSFGLKRPVARAAQGKK